MLTMHAAFCRCLLEMHSSLQSNGAGFGETEQEEKLELLPFMLDMQDARKISTAMFNIDVQAAQTYYEEDRIRILSEIDCTMGVAKFNEFLKDAFRGGLSRMLEQPGLPSIEWAALAGIVAELSGDHDYAHGLFQRVPDIRKQELGLLHQETLQSMYHLAKYSEDEEACELGHAALAYQQALLGHGHMDVANTLELLSGIKNDADMAREALAITRKNYSSAHPALISSLNNVSLILSEAEDTVEGSNQLIREALDVPRECEAAGLINKKELAVAVHNYAFIAFPSFSKDGEEVEEDDNEAMQDDAESLFREALLLTQAAVGKTHRDSAIAMVNLAEYSLHGRNAQERCSLMTEAVRILLKSNGPCSDETTRAVRELSQALEDCQQVHIAEDMLREVVAQIKEGSFTSETTDDYCGEYLLMLAKLLYHAESRQDEAKDILGSISNSIVQDGNAVRHPNQSTRTATMLLSRLYQDRGQFQKAEELLSQLCDSLRRSYSRDPWSECQALQQLAVVLRLHGRNEDAEKAEVEAFDIDPDCEASSFDWFFGIHENSPSCKDSDEGPASSDSTSARS